MTKRFPGLLNPYIAEEAMLMGVAVQRTGWSDATLRDRAVRFGLGRKIGGRWVYSRAALELFLGGREEALSRYLAGDRSDPEIIDVFRRLNLPIEPSPLPTRQRVRRGGDHAAV